MRSALIGRDDIVCLVAVVLRESLVDVFRRVQQLSCGSSVCKHRQGHEAIIIFPSRVPAAVPIGPICSITPIPFVTLPVVRLARKLPNVVKDSGSVRDVVRDISCR